VTRSVLQVLKEPKKNLVSILDNQFIKIFQAQQILFQAPLPQQGG